MRLMFILAMAAMISLASGCASTVSAGASLPPPVVVADNTKLDEQAALSLTLAYTAAATLAKVTIDRGIVKDKNVIAQIGFYDNSAKAALDAVNGAYAAGNASDYGKAIALARQSVADFLRVVKREPLS